MNTEQERAAFEAWAQNSFELHRHSAGEYSSNFTQTAWEAWQARAALQSPGVQALRKDAERYRHLRDNGDLIPRDLFNAWWLADHGNPQTLDDAIDAAMQEQKT